MKLTQLEEASRGRITPRMRLAARKEQVPAGLVLSEIAAGRAVIPANPAHAGLSASVVGKAFRTKINANIGRSTPSAGAKSELAKLHVALDAGADCLMDLSVGAGLSDIRRKLITDCPVPFGTVPVYEAAVAGPDGEVTLDPDRLMAVIEEQARQGVDFMTLHAGLLKAHLPLAAKRVMGIVSRGGTIMARWMKQNGRENPLYERWDEVLEMCRRHDVTVSLGDGLRPGCLADASDKAQFGELDVLGRLVRRCREKGVQVMVEGPGHVPLNQIEMNVRRQQKVCDEAPFYVLGPVVTDIAPGYDHITSCIGATVAAYHGASLLCYVTPAEHLGLPTSAEVHQGVMAYRIAAHAADVAKGLPGARDADDAISRARMKLDWEAQFKLALDGDHARKRYLKTCRGKKNRDYCSMCGRGYCAVRASKGLFGK